MTIPQIFEEFSHTKDSFLELFDTMLNIESNRGKFSKKTLTFYLYDFEFQIRAEIDPYKNNLTFKTYKIKESETSVGSFDSLLINSLNVTIKKESIRSHDLMAARFDCFDDNERCYTMGIEQYNDFINKYKELLEEYLKTR